VCGLLSPPFRPLTDADLASLAAEVNAARPDVVWVGLGAPKQELFMQRARPLLEAPVLAGIGAVFDFASGTKPRAPRWMQKSGLEWTHRLASEPRRLSGRYLSTNTAFLVALARETGRTTPSA
jgi:N-acetylglucosaminyldiphosphoundecaprenol N-acetyl-beta-D-mannosaminyltransferase